MYTFKEVDPAFIRSGKYKNTGLKKINVSEEIVALSDSSGQLDFRTVYSRDSTSKGAIITPQQEHPWIESDIEKQNEKTCTYI